MAVRIAWSSFGSAAQQGKVEEPSGRTLSSVPPTGDVKPESLDLPLAIAVSLPTF